ncbi:MAG: hypothetical protein J6M39_06570 [Lachnospiraceae bacterium]|nr:hypothetical protein [Lachnospiraceae bacterium]
MLNININTSYPNYDGIQYYKYENLFQTPVKETLNNLLAELDCSKLCAGKIIIPTNSFRYDEVVETYIRILFRIPIYNYILYNEYVEKLLNRHNENLEFESNYVEPKVEKTKGKIKSTRKSKPANVYVRTETYNLFTGELEYDYTNFATGDSFISSDPNLLEELNAPKRKKKEKKVPKKDFGKILLNFKMK